MAKVYGASKVKHAPMWQSLRASGINIISTWIDEAEKGVTLDFADLTNRCFREVAEADVILLYCLPGEILKGALMEVGAALALGKPIYCVGDCESLSPVFRHHPLWHTYDSIEAALAEMKNLSI